MKNYFVLILILASCNNYHKTSFEQLSEAFNSWYFITHPDNYLFLDEGNLFKKYDSISNEDYILDLKRFILELSQININKLSNNLKIDYKYINHTIDNLLFNVEHLREYENNCSFYIKAIITKIKIAHSSDIYSNFDKKNIIFNIINNSFSYLEKSKFQISNSDNIKTLEKNVDDLLILLNKIDISLNISLHNEQFSRTLITYRKYLSNYVEWIKENISSSIYDDKQDFYNKYYDKYVYNINSYNKIIKKLNYYIDHSFINLFDQSLKYYLVDNDEPIWVDKTDSLNVINWTLDKIIFNENLTNCTYETEFNSQFNYNNKNVITDSLNLVSCYDIQQKYLNKYILKSVYSKVYNIENKFYPDLHDVNAIINIVNSSITNTYLKKNDSVNKILLYLNLYHKYKQIYYQEAYLKSSISAEDIKNNINKSCFFNDENKKHVYYESIFSKYYYKLNEFIVSEKFNNHYSNEDMIDELIKQLIKNNIIK